MMDKKEFANIMKYLAVAYGKEINQDTLVVWYQFFKDYSIEEFKNGVVKAINELAFMPSIAQIKSLINETRVDKITKPEDAWLNLLKIIHKYGSYREEDAYKEMDETTKEVVDFLGYQNICMSEDQTWNRKDFISQYEKRTSEKVKDINNFQKLTTNDNEKLYLQQD